MTTASETRFAPSSSGPFAGLATRFVAVAHKVWRTTLNRRRVRSLLELDDHLLTDIGLSRADVESALSAPVDVDASTMLNRIALSNRG